MTQAPPAAFKIPTTGPWQGRPPRRSLSELAEIAYYACRLRD